MAKVRMKATIGGSSRRSGVFRHGQLHPCAWRAQPHVGRCRRNVDRCDRRAERRHGDHLGYRELGAESATQDAECPIGNARHGRNNQIIFELVRTNLHALLNLAQPYELLFVSYFARQRPPGLLMLVSEPVPNGFGLGATAGRNVTSK